MIDKLLICSQTYNENGHSVRDVCIVLTGDERLAVINNHASHLKEIKKLVDGVEIFEKYDVIGCANLISKQQLDYRLILPLLIQLHEDLKTPLLLSAVIKVPDDLIPMASIEDWNALKFVSRQNIVWPPVKENMPKPLTVGAKRHGQMFVGLIDRLQLEKQGVFFEEKWRQNKEKIPRINVLLWGKKFVFLLINSLFIKVKKSFQWFRSYFWKLLGAVCLVSLLMMASAVYLKVNLKEKPSWIDSVTGIEYVWVEPGAFNMGSDISESARRGDETLHSVTLTNGFWLSKYEVTQAQWTTVMGNNPAFFADCGKTCPVENVSWDDVQIFIKRLNKKSSLDFRLPTEAEWEYAARAGSTSPFSFGQTILSEQVNYDGNYPYTKIARQRYRKSTVVVGSFSANAWGLHDMHGNVWEWVQDKHSQYPSVASVDPVNLEKGEYRSYRGGSWYDYASLCRSASRHSNSSRYRHSSIGFRLARTDKKFSHWSYLLGVILP
ncbi:MAG: formylglycine-generating enzyme family protein [Methylococcales bacterium]|jgi:formylglycine-generating enzyme required for sulfatase activity|nr:formylglycine-generating enzyme family protein [Methylococcales bacterium]